MKRVIISLTGFAIIILLFNITSPNKYNMAELDEYVLKITKVEITNLEGEKLILKNKYANELFNFFHPKKIEKDKDFVFNSFNNNIEFYVGIKKVLEIQANNPYHINNDEQAQIIINEEPYTVSKEFYEKIRQLTMENRFRLSK